MFLEQNISEGSRDTAEKFSFPSQEYIIFKWKNRKHLIAMVIILYFSITVVAVFLVITSFKNIRKKCECVRSFMFYSKIHSIDSLA